MEKRLDVSIVLVTFNRLNDLKKTLKAWSQQTLTPARLIVVDNKSTDGTDEFLRGWLKEDTPFEKEVLFPPENIGGSGGFYEGMKRALEHESGWVFVADDDAVPAETMLKKLNDYIEKHPAEMADTVAVTSGVYNVDHFSGIHRCRIKKSILGYVESPVPEEEYSKESFEIDIYSFVGTMMKSSALKKAGLPRKEFFIYNDDYEHALRVGKLGKMVCVPASVMYHVDNLTNDEIPSWRDYYGTRNAVIMHREHFGFFGGLTRSARRIGIALIRHNPTKIKIIWTGIRDGYKGKGGLHPIYRPGWTPEKGH